MSLCVWKEGMQDKEYLAVEGSGVMGNLEERGVCARAEKSRPSCMIYPGVGGLGTAKLSVQ